MFHVEVHIGGSSWRRVHSEETYEAAERWWFREVIGRGSRIYDDETGPVAMLMRPKKEWPRPITVVEDFEYAGNGGAVAVSREDLMRHWRDEAEFTDFFEKP